jgi:hypothetical protein
MIKYKKGFKYQLAQNYCISIQVVKCKYLGQFLELTENGLLIIKKGYAWDGCSGPTLDDKTNMEASLVHDALYQLMRLEIIPHKYRLYADNLFRSLCKKHGMRKFRLWYYYKGVRWFANKASKAISKRKVYVCK